ncbi:MAG: N-acetyl-gamma-glutamyl-phosphate reductase [Planctomycetota bacterium]|nr:N-acetyl-gamma-glutamyl-phosphate reductase [Planctomycetota bacterium]
MTPGPGAGRPISCAIVGAGGYSGAELLSILLAHPRARITGLFGSDRRAEGPPVRIDEVFPRFRGRCDLPLTAASVDAIAGLAPDAVFLATPHAASHDLAPALAERGAVVLDLSAAFRLRDAALYPRHYGFEHAHPRWLAQAVYGLPELFRAQLTNAALIAVPGCYPTSAILPLAPLVRAGAIDPARRPIVDSTSGVSGAGRHATLTTSFCEVSLQPYNVFKHRHTPEIDAYCGTPVIFTPHLGAYDRGILSTIHVDLAQGWTRQRVETLLNDAYARERFVRLLPPDQWPSVAQVRGQNFCDIGWAVDDSTGHMILVSALDNLVKGAAGQAVQALNARFGLPEWTGLLPAPEAPS